MNTNTPDNLDDSLATGGVETDLNIIPFDDTNESDINSWLCYFDKICQEKKKDECWKLNNVSRFIKGKALWLYVKNCQEIKTYPEFVQILRENFVDPTLTTFGDFANLKYNIRDDITQYFRKKMEIGKQLKLNHSMILEGLTDGLPTDLKALMTINEPLDPITWLNQAHKLIKINEPKTENPRFVAPYVENSQSYGRNLNFRQPGSRVNNRPNFDQYPRNNNFRPSNFQRFQGPNTSHNNHRPRFSSHHTCNNYYNLPPSPCRLCTQRGIPNAYHWFQVCPFRREGFGMKEESQFETNQNSPNSSNI